MTGIISRVRVIRSKSRAKVDRELALMAR